jgi:hypothetical protein
VSAENTKSANVRARSRRNCGLSIKGRKKVRNAKSAVKFGYVKNVHRMD